MYLKIDSEKIKEIEKITMTEYEKEGNFLTVDTIEAIIDDLLIEINNQKEKNEEDYDLNMADEYYEQSKLGLI